MRQTDELRRLLDERNVSWEPEDHHTTHVTVLAPNVLIVEGGEHDDMRIATSEGLAVVVTRLTPEQAVEATLGARITGDTSDGYHTFNELYHHRAVLFSVIVRDHRELAWKSKLHHDGTMYDGMFIVGIETPHGQATYHYDVDPYWDMFDCRELERAPEWDGHTPSNAIERIATLGRPTCRVESMHTNDYGYAPQATDFTFELSCGHSITWDERPDYCPRCGAKVVG